MNTTSSLILITSAAEQEKAKIGGGILETNVLNFERKQAEVKEKFEMIPEAFETLKKRLDDKLVQFELAQKTQGQITGDLKTLEGRFSEKMGFIRNFIEEIQGFVNKLERRVLQVEHIVYSNWRVELQ